MKLAKLGILTVLLLSSASLCVAGARAPVPRKLMEAKAIYLDNRTGDATLGDRAYDELTKWGRFKIVDSPKDADLVFAFTTETWSAGSYTTGTVNSYGTVTTATATTVPASSGTTCLTVFDAKTGEQVWANSKDWGRFKSATRGIIKDLKDRMEMK